MKKKLFRMLAVMSMALTVPTLSSCFTLEELQAMGLDTSNLSALFSTLAGTTAADGTMYDANGNPIYGYDGEYAVYGYDPSGNPIYDVALLSSTSVVPQWAPREGAAPRPHGMRHGGPPPHARHRHGDHLRKPGERVRRPRQGGRPDRKARPNDRHRGGEARGERRGGRPSFGARPNDRRPGGGDARANRPQGGKPGGRAGAGPGNNKGERKAPGGGERPQQPGPR